jgi:hypothetical protein
MHTNYPETREDIEQATRAYIVAYLTDSGFPCHAYENEEVLRAAALEHWDTANKTEFEFEELSPSAKEKAIQEYAESALDNEWASYYIDKFKEEQRIKGFIIEECHWALGYCQSDGASWEGQVDVRGYLHHTMTDTGDACKLDILLELAADNCISRMLPVENTRHLGMRIEDFEVYVYDGEKIGSKHALFAGADAHAIFDAIGGEAYLEELHAQIEVAVEASAHELYTTLRDANDAFYEELTSRKRAMPMIGCSQKTANLFSNYQEKTQ